MTEISLLYHEFWSGLDENNIPTGGGFVDAFTGRLIPAFPDDEIISPAPYPAITYPIIQPQFRSGMVASASIWDRRPAMPGFKGLTNDVLRQLTKYIPPNNEGLILKVPDVGYIRMLFGNFSYLRDEDAAVTRAVFNFSVESYISH